MPDVWAGLLRWSIHTRCGVGAMAVLQVLKGLTPGQQFPILAERSILGRHPDCDIVLDVGAVSRQHAQIVQVGDDYFVEDLHSRNGTFVNNRPIQAPHRLQDGDKLKICDLTFSFYFDQPRDKLGRGLGDTGPGLALMVDDAEERSSSTIMSTLDISSVQGSVRLNVNPEVKLRALIEISQNLSRALSVEEVLPKVLDSLFKIFVQADRGFVVMRATPDGPLIPKAVKHRRKDAEETIRISRTVIHQVLAGRQAVLSADAASDTRFEMSQSIADFRIRSMMCAPLIDGDGTAFGAIQIDTLDQRSRFQQEDLDVLAGVTTQAAMMIDNAQLHERALRQQGLQRDLELAHKVQQGLLPSSPPQVPEYHFFDFYEPANQVGGDFYDYISLPDGRLGVVLADVSGKGVSAALLMAKLSAEVRYCLVTERSPDKAVSRINATFCHSGWEDRFVTLVLAVLDPTKHEVTLVNAGHMPPFLRMNQGKVEPVGGDLSGVPLGVDADYQYEQFKFQLQPGQFLTLFTDGISEAMNSRGELYGLERLQTQVGSRVESVPALGRAILDDVRRFVGGQTQSDDMCLACFGRAH